MSEEFILTSTNPQYDKRFFIDLSVQYMKTTSSEQVVYKNCSECKKQTIVYTTCSELAVCMYTDRKNVTNFLYLVLHWACKVTCYYQLVSSVLFSVLRTSTNVLSKSKSRNCVTWIPNVTKLFLSVQSSKFRYQFEYCLTRYGCSCS